MMYDFTPAVRIVLTGPDGLAGYLYDGNLHDHFLDVVPQVGDMLTTLWPDDEVDSYKVVARSLVTRWEYPDEKAWVLIVTPVGLLSIEAAAFAEVREMTRLRMEARGMAPRDPDAVDDET